MEDFFLDNNAIEEKIDEKNNETRQKLKRYTTMAAQMLQY